MSFRSAVSGFFDGCRAWIALALVGFAYRISPVGVLPVVRSAEGLPNGKACHFRVERKVGVTSWALYDGPDGGEARRQYEGVKSRGELGEMKFKMDDGSGWVVRGIYNGKPQ